MSKPKSKIKKPYVAATLIVFLLCLMAKNAHAATYDLQPYTSCLAGVCSTSLDVATLGLSQNKINALKTVNITAFLIKSGVINNFAYSWNGNVVTITGRVSSNVYWKFAAGGDSFDPWWNQSSFSFDYANATTPDTVNTGNQLQGITIIAKVADKNICNTTKVGTSGANTSHIVNSLGEEIARATFVGNTATFNPMVPITNGQVYYILADKYNVSVDTPYKIAAGFPITTANNINLLNGSYWDGSKIATDTITRIYTQIITCGWDNTSTYYSFDLNLNYSAANLTIEENTSFIIAGITNLTNINTTLYVNDTIYNSSIGNVTNITSLTVGLWNITAGSNNTDSVTYWALVTATPITPTTTNLSISWNVNMNDAPGICLADNVTFQRQTNISYGSTYQTLTENFTCPYGCDANACNYPTWINNLIILIIVGVALYLIYKVV